MIRWRLSGAPMAALIMHRIAEGTLSAEMARTERCEQRNRRNTKAKAMPICLSIIVCISAAKCSAAAQNWNEPDRRRQAKASPCAGVRKTLSWPKLAQCYNHLPDREHVTFNNIVPAIYFLPKAIETSLPKPMKHGQLYCERRGSSKRWAWAIEINDSLGISWPIYRCPAPASMPAKPLAIKRRSMCAMYHSSRPASTQGGRLIGEWRILALMTSACSPPRPKHIIISSYGIGDIGNAVAHHLFNGEEKM